MVFNKKSAREIILDLASKRGQIVYGQQSINEQIPSYLKRKTKDYDILTKNPKESAQELVELLNKQNGNYKVVKAIYPRTWKVKNEQGETIADYTRPGRLPNTTNVLGVKYADLQYSKRKAEKILRKPEASYRWEKDKDVLERIKKGGRKPW